MHATAAVRAVLSTLARATADGRTPVVLRTRSAGQARDLARWLACVHGSERTVIASSSATGLIEVRLPTRLDWQVVPHEEFVMPLAAILPDPHLSPMAHFSSPGGTR
jgi:hypothetical protein